MKRKKVGLALGGGSARGLSHIGILKVLDQQRILPDYIAGTSMGAVIGALYAAGYNGEQIEEIAETTNWKTIVDFTIPKYGLIQGDFVEEKLRTLLHHKEFKDLRIPLRVVAYNINTREEVVFSSGNVAQALRASLSIPGIFSPLRIGTDAYIDGFITNPTPFAVVKEMGADIVIAADLYAGEKKPPLEVARRRKSLFADIKLLFILEELKHLKKLLFPEEWPGFIRRLLVWIFDKLVYPARIMRFLARRELPILSVMDEAIQGLAHNLAKEKLAHAKIDIKITPSFGHLTWSDFDLVHDFVKIGEKSMNTKMPLLKQKLGR